MYNVPIICDNVPIICDNVYHHTSKICRLGNNKLKVKSSLVYEVL